MVVVVVKKGKGVVDVVNVVVCFVVAVPEVSGRKMTTLRKMRLNGSTTPWVCAESH